MPVFIRGQAVSIAIIVSAFWWRRGELNSLPKLSALQLTTSVSPVLFLDAALCRGHLDGRPIRFI